MRSSSSISRIKAASCPPSSPGAAGGGAAVGPETGALRGDVARSTKAVPGPGASARCVDGKMKGGAFTGGDAGEGDGCRASRGDAVTTAGDRAQAVRGRAA